MMSTSNYVAIAKIFGTLRAQMGQPSERRVLSAVEEALSDYFLTDNPRFRPETFAITLDRAHGEALDRAAEGEEHGPLCPSRVSG